MRTEVRRSIAFGPCAANGTEYRTKPKQYRTCVSAHILSNKAVTHKLDRKKECLPKLGLLSVTASSKRKINNKSHFANNF